MKIYISGPMAGYPDLNFGSFDRMERELIAKGFITVSPAFIGRRDTDLSYEVKLRKALQLLLECDAVCMLRGWQTSLGAKLEFAIANALKMEIFYEREDHS